MIWRVFTILALLLSVRLGAESANSKDDGEAPLVSTESNKVGKIEREDSEILQRHQPFYFVYGDPTSKLQISFKSPMVRRIPLYFAYTQLMFWALSEESKPFRDLTYNPELFYRIKFPDSVFQSLDLGIWSHMSNGKGGSDSRSYDKNYARINMEKEFTRWLIKLAIEVGYLHRLDPTNNNIQNYVGPLKVEVRFVQLYNALIDKSEISFTAAPGGRLADRISRGGYQVSWSFRLGRLALVPAFYLQYYNGYAETLLNYDKQVSELRAGVIF